MTVYANLYGPTWVEYPSGTHAANVPVTVLESSGLTPAVLYTDKDRSATVTNPILTDSLGNLSFWVDPGDYVLRLPPGSDSEFTVGLHPAEPVSGGGGDSAIVHTQSVPSSAWIITHNLGRLPIVDLWVGGELQYTDVDANNSTATLTFPAPSVGTAILH